MSEPITERSVASVASLPPDEVVHEGGGAPATGEEKETYEALDGSVVEKPKTRGRPRMKPTLPAAEKQEAAAEGEKEGEVPPEQRTPPERGRPGEQDFTKFSKPGESEQDTLVRLWQENRGRAAAEYHQRKELEERLAAAAHHMERQTQMLEPLLRKQWQEAQAQKMREDMAAIPDRETQPDEYRTFLAEETLRRQLAWEQKTEAEKQAAVQEWQRQQAEEQQLAALVELDEGIAQETRAIGEDPEVSRAYYTSLWQTAQQLRAAYPEATDDQIEELTYGSHLLELRELRQQGRSPREYYATQAQILQQAFGMLTPAQAAAVAGNGNGGNGQVGSPTAAKVAREAAVARAAQVVGSGGTPGRAGGMPGESLDPSNFASEDEYLEWALQTPKGTTEGYLKRQLGKPARR